MPRVFGSISEGLLHRFDTDCADKGLTRSEALSHAIDAYLNNGNTNNCAELEHLRTALDQQSQQILNLNILLDAQRSEINYLRDHATALTTKIIPALPIPEPQAQDMVKPKKTTLEVLGKGDNHIKSIYRPYPR